MEELLTQIVDELRALNAKMDIFNGRFTTLMTFTSKLVIPLI